MADLYKMLPFQEPVCIKLLHFLSKAENSTALQNRTEVTEGAEGVVCAVAQENLKF